MKIHKECRVELAASKDASRYAISEPCLTIEDGKPVLYATDGRILVILPVETDATDTAGYVSAECLKAARKASPRSDTAQIGLNGVATFNNGATMPRAGEAKDAKFPNCAQVVPKDLSGHTTVIAFDAKRLWLLAQAMGTQCVLLRVKDSATPIMVEPTNAGPNSDAEKFVCEAARGVLMPIKL